MIEPIALRRYAPGLAQPMHDHPHGSISLVVRGEVFETCGGVTRRAGPGDLIVKPAGTRHADLYGDGGAALYTIATDTGTLAYRTRFGGPATALFAAAVAEWRAGRASAGITNDLVAALHDDRPARRSSRMRDVAERLSSSDVTVESVARDLGMHPVALARAFRREHGCSITAYRRRRRARAAARLLASTGMPLVDIALECGFSDHSHFCRVFKRETGLAPSVFRSLLV